MQSIILLESPTQSPLFRINENYHKKDLPVCARHKQSSSVAVGGTHTHLTLSVIMRTLWETVRGNWLLGASRLLSRLLIATTVHTAASQWQFCADSVWRVSQQWRVIVCRFLLILAVPNWRTDGQTDGASRWWVSVRTVLLLFRHPHFRVLLPVPITMQ